MVEIMIDRIMKKILGIIVIASLLTSCATSKSNMKCAFGVYCNAEVEEKLEKNN